MSLCDSNNEAKKSTYNNIRNPAVNLNGLQLLAPDLLPFLIIITVWHH